MLECNASDLDDDDDALCRSSIVRMSSDNKQNVGSKTVEDERIQVGVLRALVDEMEERDLSADEDDEVDNEESDKSVDTGKSGSRTVGMNFAVKQ